MRESCFDPRRWEELTAAAEAEPECPRWLVDVLAELGRLAPRLPLEDDEPETRFDMVYPH